MKMIQVRSSAIRAAGYDPSTRRMRIAFEQGHSYDSCGSHSIYMMWIDECIIQGRFTMTISGIGTSASEYRLEGACLQSNGSSRSGSG